MGRGDPPPVAIPMRDFGDEGGGLHIRSAVVRSDEDDEAGHCCNCGQEENEASHDGSSIQYASVRLKLALLMTMVLALASGCVFSENKVASFGRLVTPGVALDHCRG